MEISYDPAKRARTLEERGIDFDDAALVFDGVTVDSEDLRFAYGETRIITIGHLRDRMMVIVWTPRGQVRHVISMRKANDRERTRYSGRLGRPG